MATAAETLRQRIERSGRVTFAEFMEQALYGEDGYYQRDDLGIGEQRDFITGSSHSPLFAQATATILHRLDGLLGRQADFLEVGYGSAVHLRWLTEEFDKTVPRRILAWDRVARPLPEGVDRLSDLEQVDRLSIEGLIFSYELFDALPVHRLKAAADGSLGELWVEVGPDGSFAYTDGELSTPELAHLLAGTQLAPGQVADLSILWAPLYRRMAGILKRGLLVTCDYGFERHRLLDPRAHFHGTLASYSRQTVHRNALMRVGEQDLTAHVDFTTLREIGEQEGLVTLALTRQARWLMACGIFERLQDAEPEIRLQARTLLDPAGMGEEIRVLIQARDLTLEGLAEPLILASAIP